MSMIGTIIKSDFRRITSNIASIIIVLGLTVIPGLFAWFNIAACWDPFANTKNLQFAIANDDEGYKSDLLPMKVSIGDEVLNSLRANSQLDWNFTTSAEAIDGTKSGTYYAAVVIPKDFSKTMMTFFTGDADHATLDYYTNEKLNALAPKVTGQGADDIAAEINQMFAKTITDTALNLASSIMTYLDKPQAQDAMKNFNANIGDLADTLTQSATALKAYSSLTSSAQELIDSSQELIKQSKSSATSAADELSDSKQAVSDLSGALDTSVEALGTALSTSATSLADLNGRIDTLLNSVDNQATSTADALTQLGSTIRNTAGKYSTLHDDLQTLLNNSGLPATSAVRVRLQAAIDRLGATRDTLNQLASNLDQAASDVNSRVDSNSQTRQDAKDLATQAKNSITGLSDDFNTTIKPDLAKMNTAFTDAASQMNATASTLKSAVDDLDSTSATAKEQLDTVRSLIDDSATDLDDAAKQLTDLNSKLSKALNTGDMEMVKQILGSNSTTLAATLSAPVQLDRIAVFPVENFGAALTPFYTFLPLWVGAILLAVCLKTQLSDKRREELGNPKPWQEYLGHYVIFLTIALMQSTFSLGGTLLFLRVQTVHPWLFMLTGWVSALVFSLFTYTLVGTFGNIGKAICVLFLVMQISGSDAAYPLAVLPKFVNDVSPFLPVTYSVTALRGAIAGIYENGYWIALGKLLIFAAVLLVIGLVLRKPLSKFDEWFSSQVESTKIVA